MRRGTLALCWFWRGAALRGRLGGRQLAQRGAARCDADEVQDLLGLAAGSKDSPCICFGCQKRENLLHCPAH